HLLSVALALVPAGAGAGTKIIQLLQDVVGGQAGWAGVVGTALAVGIMAEAAGVDGSLLIGSLLAMGDDVGHLGVVFGEPVGRPGIVINLLDGEGLGAARNVMNGVAIFRWRRRRCGRRGRSRSASTSTAAGSSTAASTGRSRRRDRSGEAVRPGHTAVHAHH